MRFHNLCRTCLRTGDQMLILPDSIMPKLEAPSESVIEMWKIVAKVLMSDSESSNQICKSCLEEVNRCYLFLVKCEQSGVILKGMREAAEANIKINKETIVTATSIPNTVATTTTAADIKFEEKCINFINIPQFNSTQQITGFDNVSKVWHVPPTIEAQVIVSQPVVQQQTVVCKPEILNFETKVTNTGTNLTNIITIPHSMLSGEPKMHQAVEKTVVPVKVASTAVSAPKKPKRKAKEYNCETCFQTFKTKQALQNHVTRDHESNTAESHLRCPVCPLVFVVAADLRAHLRTHPKDSPYTCEFCPRKFRYKTSLAYHATIKHGVAFQKCGD